jgi:hypothetical protein
VVEGIILEEDAVWCDSRVRHVGAYGEIFDRNVGPGSKHGNQPGFWIEEPIMRHRCRRAAGLRFMFPAR